MSKRRRSLTIACERLRIQAAVLLLRWGADEKIKDTDGQELEIVVRNDIDTAARANRAQDIAGVHRLLARAPADRSWRRRGMLVICRARLASVMCKQDESHVADDTVPVAKSKCTKVSRADNGPSCVEIEAVGVERGGENANEHSFMDAVGKDLSIEEWVASVAKEELFRVIMRFVWPAMCWRGTRGAFSCNVGKKVALSWRRENDRYRMIDVKHRWRWQRKIPCLPPFYITCRRLDFELDCISR